MPTSHLVGKDVYRELGRKIDGSTKRAKDRALAELLISTAVSATIGTATLAQLQ